MEYAHMRQRIANLKAERSAWITSTAIAGSRIVFSPGPLPPPAFHADWRTGWKIMSRPDTDRTHPGPSNQRARARSPASARSPTGPRFFLLGNISHPPLSCLETYNLYIKVLCIIFSKLLLREYFFTKISWYTKFLCITSFNQLRRRYSLA